VHTVPMYSDADTAALYDRLNPWGPSDDFYLSFVMAAPSVLDVGCGTGRLCGVDPDLAALERARRRADVEWVEGSAADLHLDGEFALAVMASNVFQVFVTDEELRASVESVVGDVVTLTETTATRDGHPLRVDRASLRFLDVEGIDAFLGGAGFEVEARYGDWTRGPLTGTSDNIVTVARAA
jgi:SAM-dependent methyltransferase